MLKVFKVKTPIDEKNFLLPLKYFAAVACAGFPLIFTFFLIRVFRHETTITAPVWAMTAILAPLPVLALLAFRWLRVKIVFHPGSVTIVKLFNEVAIPATKIDYFDLVKGNTFLVNDKFAY